MKPAKRDADPQAASHAGQHGDFGIHWIDTGRLFTIGSQYVGWWVTREGQQPVGPFHTSQAAFGAMKDAIDSTLRS